MSRGVVCNAVAIVGIERVETAMCKVPFEVAMRARTIDPVGVDSEQLRH